MNTLERTRQELDSTKQRLSSTQQSLQERDTHLTNMRQERRKQLEEILEMKLVGFCFFTSLDVFLAFELMQIFHFLMHYLFYLFILSLFFFSIIERINRREVDSG